MTTYSQIPALADLVLEESWVRQVLVTPGRLTVLVEAVIAADGARLGPPRAGEKFFWLPAALLFSDVSDLDWRDQRPPWTDPDGTQHWGHIDTFSSDGDRYALAGGMGDIDVVARDLTVRVGDSADRDRIGGLVPLPVDPEDLALLPRMVLQPGTDRTPGGRQPHAELSDDNGHRIGADGEPVGRRSVEAFLPIEWDLD